MARPSKGDTVRRNGNSLKVYRDGVYVGSISITELGELLKERGR